MRPVESSQTYLSEITALKDRQQSTNRVNFTPNLSMSSSFLTNFQERQHKHSKRLQLRLSLSHQVLPHSFYAPSLLFAPQNPNGCNCRVWFNTDSQGFWWYRENTLLYSQLVVSQPTWKLLNLSLGKEKNGWRVSKVLQLLGDLERIPMISPSLYSTSLFLFLPIVYLSMGWGKC